MNCYVDRPVGRDVKWSIMGAVQGRLKRHDGREAEARLSHMVYKRRQSRVFMLMDNKEIHVQLSHSPRRSG